MYEAEFADIYDRIHAHRGKDYAGEAWRHRCIERWQVEAGLSGEVVDPLSPVDVAEVGVRRVPVPARGDRPRSPLEADHSRLKHRLRSMAGYEPTRQHK